MEKELDNTSSSLVTFGISYWELEEFFLDSIFGDLGASLGESLPVVSSFRSDILDLMDRDDLTELAVSERAKGNPPLIFSLDELFPMMLRGSKWME